MLNSKTRKKIELKALNVETGEFQSKILDLEPGIRGECLIGRHPSCSIVLNLPEVSRIHGRIFFLDGQCYYTDLGSEFGSQINSEKVEFNRSYLLKSNDLLCIAQFVITFTDFSASDKISQAEQSKSSQNWGELDVRCIQVINETEDVKTFCFVAEPTMLFDYKPGQFVTFNLLINGQKVKRSYSISSSPSRPYSIDVTVKRVAAPSDEPDAPPGLVSNWLHDNVKPGSRLKIMGPMGNFTCADLEGLSAKKLLFISAGSGITPVMSMSRWFYDRRSNIDITFIHCARTPNDIIFRSELELMATKYPNFKLAVTITRLESGAGWHGDIGNLHGYTGRLNESMLKAIASDFKNRTVYVCGPNPFMAATKTMLEDLQFPLSNYYQESFGGSKPKKAKALAKASKSVATPKQLQSAAAAPVFPSLPPSPFFVEEEDQESNVEQSVSVDDSPISVDDSPISVDDSPMSVDDSPIIVFSNSGTEIACDEEDFILDVAEEEGVDIPSGCRMGVCGACKIPLAQGKVEYDDDPECDPGYILACVAKARGRVVLEV